MDVDAVRDEMNSTPDVLQLVKDGDIDSDVYPLSVQLLKEFRKSETFTERLAAKMTLGAEPMKDIGNVYCAALPAWIAAGLEEAAEQGRDLAGRPVLAVGYGSGDAAAVRFELVDTGSTVARESKEIAQCERCHRHAVIGSVHERRGQAAAPTAR